MQEKQNKTNLKNKLENFWYYHKYATIAVILFLLIGLWWISDGWNQSTSDLKISLVTADAVTEETIRINDSLSHLISDADSDGIPMITTAQIPLTEDLSTDEGKTYEKMLNSQLSTRGATLFIFDQLNLDRVWPKDAFCPLDAFFNVSEYGDRVVYRDGTPIAFHLQGSQTLKDLGFINDDLYAMLLFQLPEEERDSFSQVEYQNAVAILTELLK